VILADTSIWIDHLRKGKTALTQNEKVIVHPFIIGKAALGQMGHRKLVLDALHNLPRARVCREKV